MRSCLLALSLLGASCNQEPQNQQVIQETPHLYFSSESLEKLSNDVARWTNDGKIDYMEKIEILRASGYNIKIHHGPWAFRASYIWNGNDWQPLGKDIDNFPISSGDMYRLIDSYRK
ncbi:MAG: hypothetical protein ACP5N7_01675 [Candidatus Pacearchaeota archaeon]